VVPAGVLVRVVSVVLGATTAVDVGGRVVVSAGVVVRVVWVVRVGSDGTTAVVVGG
jgi:hypothetical protein